MSRNQCRLYVGNLPPSTKAKDVEDLFDRFGKVLYVDLREKRGLPFAFVEFEDRRDAKDSILKCDGCDYEGYKLRVEFSRDSKSTRDRLGGNGRERGTRKRRSQYRVIVSGLPPSASWQDLKDHMRKVGGDVYFADVYEDGSGIAEFGRYQDMKDAVKELDHSKFRSHEDETSNIRVKEDYDREGGDDSGRSRSRSYSPPRRSGRGRRLPSDSPNRYSTSRSRSRSYDRHRR